MRLILILLVCGCGGNIHVEGTCISEPTTIQWDGCSVRWGHRPVGVKISEGTGSSGVNSYEAAIRYINAAAGCEVLERGDDILATDWQAEGGQARIAWVGTGFIGCETYVGAGYTPEGFGAAIAQHEIAHCLGLQHVEYADEPDDIMNPSVGADQIIGERAAGIIRRLYCDVR